MSTCIFPVDLHLDKDGYPKAKYKGKSQPAGRIIMRLLYGDEAIKGKLVCHTCGHRSCLNPQHLYLGTPQSNSDDKYRDGTMATGEKNGRFRPEIQTEVIIRLYNDEGYSQQDISRMTGLSQSAVSGRIRRYKDDR